MSEELKATERPKEKKGVSGDLRESILHSIAQHCAGRVGMPHEDLEVVVDAVNAALCNPPLWQTDLQILFYELYNKPPFRYLDEWLYPIPEVEHRPSHWHEVTLSEEPTAEDLPF